MIDDPELDGTDAAHPAYWRGHDHAVAVLCQKITEILVGKDDGKGIASEPWEPVRRRLLAMNSDGGQMTALERAEAIVARLHVAVGTIGTNDRWVCDAIHRAIIEHSNAELELRRAVEARVQNASQKLRSLIKWLRESGSPRGAQMAEAALKALEGE